MNKNYKNSITYEDGQKYLMITSQYNVLVNFSAKKMAARANEARSACRLAHIL
jgi:hypothetical protein